MGGASVRVICDRTIAARVKGKVYKMVLRPALMYNLEMEALIKKTGGQAGGG